MEPVERPERPERPNRPEPTERSLTEGLVSDLEEKGLAPPLLSRPDGRFVDATKLVPFKGGLHTLPEIEEIRRYAGVILPLSHMPRTLPRDREASNPLVTYRRRVYGPYDHLSPEVFDEVFDEADRADQADQADPANRDPRLGPGQGRALYTFRAAPHRGQTKLCCVELEALTLAVRRCPGLKYVLYAGAAPGDHIAFLAEAFPALEFHLVDPAEFRVQRRYGVFPGVASRIHARKGLFTDEQAREWEDRASQTFFISDVRSGDHSQEEYEREVWANMQMQLGWWTIIRPAGALFKFRLPYTDGAHDAHGAHSARCRYLDGDILLQPFGPNTSTEGRLLVWRGAAERSYDLPGYEDYYFWLNNIVREWASFDHGLDLRAVDGLCRCFDCSRMVQIFRDYARDFPADPDLFGSADSHVAYLIGRMIEATSQRLYCPPHGDMTECLPSVKREALAAQYGQEYLRRRKQRIRSRALRINTIHAPLLAQSHARPAARPPRPESPPDFDALAALLTRILPHGGTRPASHGGADASASTASSTGGTGASRVSARLPPPAARSTKGRVMPLLDTLALAPPSAFGRGAPRNRSRKVGKKGEEHR